MAMSIKKFNQELLDLASDCYAFHSQLSHLLSKIDQNTWICHYINKTHLDYIANILNSISIDNKLLDFIKKVVNNKMDLHLIEIFTFVSKILTLNDEILVIHGNLNQEDKEKIMTDIVKIHPNFENLLIKFRDNSAIIKGLVILVGFEMYDLSLSDSGV